MSQPAGLAARMRAEANWELAATETEVAAPGRGPEPWMTAGR